MNLVWHIAKKDLRRMAAPVAVWLALVLAGAIWFRTAEPSLVGHVASEIDEWGSLVTIWSVLLTTAELMLAIVLTGALMLEDRVASPHAFWPTRPIAGGRLLAAKALAAFLCFIVAPIVVQLPVWLSIGCTVGDVVGAAVNFTGTFGFAVLFAVAVASLVKGLGELALMVTVLGIGCWIALIPGMRENFGALYVAVPVRVAFALLFAVVAVYQFVTRRTLHGAIVLTAGVCLAMIVAWWGSVPSRRDDAQTERPILALPAPPAEVPQAIMAPSMFWKGAADANVYRVVTRPNSDLYLAPGIARDSGGRIVLMPRSWGHEIAARAFGITTQPTDVWDLFPADDAAAQRHDLVGSLDVWRVRPVIVGEVPLRTGATLSGSFGRLRIAAVNQDRGEVVIEERAVAPRASNDFPSSLRAFALLDRESRLSVDIYACVNRGSGQVVWVWNDTQVRHLARHNGQAVGYRRLGPNNLRNWESASLVKIRLECERVYELPINVRGVTTEPPIQRGEGTPPTTERRTSNAQR